MADTPPLSYIHRGNDEAGFFAHSINRGGTNDLLAAVPGNMPPAEGPYVCLVSVLDYWRMIGALAAKNGVWHYAAGIEPQILSDIRARRCALIFDLSNEGPEYYADVFDELFRWIEQHQLPPKQVIWLAQNRRIEAQCRAAVGPRADLVGFEYYDFFIREMALMFSGGVGQQFVGVDPEDLISRMFAPERKDRMLLCLNATPRLPRVLTVSALMHHGLLANSLVSFPGMSYVKDSGSAADVRRYIDANPKLAYLMPSVEKTLVLSDLKVDDFAEQGNALFAKVDLKPYERTFFSLVTETDFTNGSVDRVTEKIVKPFCLGHPSLLVGNPNAVRFMTELGFQDWVGVLDRSYELETDPPTRFQMLFNEVLRQVGDIVRYPVVWLARVQEVGSANIRHALSGAFLSRYSEMYDRPLVARFARLVGAPAEG